MKTLGIDLAAQPKNTAFSLIEWGKQMSVNPPVTGADDDQLLEAMKEADWIAIDAPFGWPAGFVETIVAYSEKGKWPADWEAASLRLRETDRIVAERTAEAGAKANPLSVSADKIAVCAMRAAGLLTRHTKNLPGGTLDRVGGVRGRKPAKKKVIEAYPRAAVAMWGLPVGTYRGGNGSKQRGQVLTAIKKASGGKIDLSRATRAKYVANEHALDALICSLVARAGALGLTGLPSRAQATLARKEGWIHLPEPGSLARL
jgi:predicted nuclease with RNAse H fold